MFKRIWISNRILWGTRGWWVLLLWVRRRHGLRDESGGSCLRLGHLLWRSLYSDILIGIWIWNFWLRNLWWRLIHRSLLWLLLLLLLLDWLWSSKVQSRPGVLLFILLGSLLLLFFLLLNLNPIVSLATFLGLWTSFSCFIVLTNIRYWVHVLR